jgi:hypothetical protein
MGTLPELRLEFDDAAHLREQWQSNLRKGRAFVVGATGIAERDLCQLVIVHPVTGETRCVAADAVWVKREEPGAGVGLEFQGFDAAAAASLEQFVAATESAAGAARGGSARSLWDRIRHLTVHERDVMARQGTLPERVALERQFGGAVWETLLANPNLTPPEVMRIAKNGTLPTPLVASIAANPAWLAVPEIQRALLSNPRVSGTHLDRVLRALPPADLVRVAQQTSYPAATRLAAKRLAKR